MSLGCRLDTLPLGSPVLLALSSLMEKFWGDLTGGSLPTLHPAIECACLPERSSGFGEGKENHVWGTSQLALSPPPAPQSPNPGRPDFPGPQAASTEGLTASAQI
jgi:hypothetical protein